MDLDTLSKAVIKSFCSLADAWLVKGFIVFLVGAATSIHGVALTAFIVLVVIDLFSKWIALAYAHLKDCNKENDLFSCIADIPGAIKAGYINSDEMKHRFAGKIIVYMILTFMAVNVDTLLFASGESPIILKVVWSYLAATEAMSVLENLRDAGIEQAGSLLSFLRDRTTILLDRFKQK
ncbi:MAG: phage holin family protein [Sporomusaceae bacterium]|nr:phage holin family protein [Sporomusaceae bacterium]